METLDPQTYIKQLSLEDRAKLASAIGASKGHVNNIANGQRSVSHLFAVRIERYTKGLVPRQKSCPDTWQEMWGEPLLNLGRHPAANDGNGGERPGLEGAA